MTKQYEWAIDQVSINDIDSDVSQDYLNDIYSEDGYKLHTVIPYGEDYVALFFEREKKPAVTWDDYDVDAGVDAMREQEALPREEDD